MFNISEKQSFKLKHSVRMFTGLLLTVAAPDAEMMVGEFVSLKSSLPALIHKKHNHLHSYGLI